MGIGVKGYPYAGMAQTLLDCLEVYSLLQEQRGVGVPGITEADAGEAVLSG